MTAAVIGIVSAIITTALAGFSFYIAYIERRARKKTEREYMEKWEHEKQMAESVTDANAKKEKLQSGNSRDDFSAGIDLLHEYTKKAR